MRRIAYYFLQGLIFLVPIVVTLWVVGSAFLAIDDSIRHLIGVAMPGLGFLVMLVSVIAFGFLASNFLTRRLMLFLDRQLDRLPLLKLLHTSIRDLMSAFVGEKRRFGRPVLVDIAGDGRIKALGYLTRDSMERFGRPDDVAVYFPQSYNFAGQVVIVPSAAVTHLAVDAAEVMAFIVSGGVTGQ
ncbi:MAG TPA: DUF502 domain-containing protein [Polyangia bacterium]|jgi:uncharacterized membrane protein|nr:DUF502 domain-containing protein [Polyangia bacterium]